MKMHRDVPGGDHCDVYLDGVKIFTCHEADDSEGWARCHMLDSWGRIITDPESDDGMRFEIRRGAVSFAFIPPEERQKAERYWSEQAGVE